MTFYVIIFTLLGNVTFSIFTEARMPHLSRQEDGQSRKTAKGGIWVNLEISRPEICINENKSKVYVCISFIEQSSRQLQKERAMFFLRSWLSL